MPSDPDDGPPLSLRERLQLYEERASKGSAATLRSQPIAPLKVKPTHSPPAPYIPRKPLAAKRSFSSSPQHSTSVTTTSAAPPIYTPLPTPSPQLPRRPVQDLVSSYVDPSSLGSLAHHHPPLSPTLSAGSSGGAASPVKSRGASPALSFGSRRSSDYVSAVEDSWSHRVQSELPPLDTAPRNGLTSPSMDKSDIASPAASELDGMKSFWNLQPPTTTTRPSETLQSNSAPPPLPRRKPTLPSASSTLSSTSSLAPALPPRPRPSPQNSIDPSATSAPLSPPLRQSYTPTSTPSAKHSRHRPSEFESISLSSDGAASLAQSLASDITASSPSSNSTTPKPTPRSTPPRSRTVPPPPPPSSVSKTIPVLPTLSTSTSPPSLSTYPRRDPLRSAQPASRAPSKARRPVDPHARARYESLFDSLTVQKDRPGWIKKDEGAKVDGAVVRIVWERSRLSKSFLKKTWTLADSERTGSLGKEQFVLAMWVIDEELRAAQSRNKP